jgi:hypothetical protein
VRPDGMPGQLTPGPATRGSSTAAPGAPQLSVQRIEIELATAGQVAGHRPTTSRDQLQALRHRCLRSRWHAPLRQGAAPPAQRSARRTCFPPVIGWQLSQRRRRHRVLPPATMRSPGIRRAGMLTDGVDRRPGRAGIRPPGPRARHQDGLVRPEVEMHPGGQLQAAAQALGDEQAQRLEGQAGELRQRTRDGQQQRPSQLRDHEFGHCSWRSVPQADRRRCRTASPPRPGSRASAQAPVRRINRAPGRAPAAIISLCPGGQFKHRTGARPGPGCHRRSQHRGCTPGAPYCGALRRWTAGNSHALSHTSAYHARGRPRTVQAGTTACCTGRQSQCNPAGGHASPFPKPR